MTAKRANDKKQASRSHTKRPSKRAVVPVELGERSYSIEISHDWLETIGRRAAKRLAAERIALVTVPTVARRYAPALTRGLRSGGSKVARIVVPDGDASKNLRQLGELYDQFLEHGRRHTPEGAVESVSARCRRLTRQTST